ncbi:MAG: class F sortase, partial [Pseudonocardiales bacterium]|nr:class F sortase [Pseudonocardiales bacterium]
VAIRHAAPTAVLIPRVRIASTLVDLRKNPNGTVQVPKDFGQAGWYVGSAHPGDAGPTVLIGHVDSYKGPGVFFRLPELHKGDRITVRRADHSNAVFVVREVKTFAKRAFPTALVYGGKRASLRLVTCGGQFDRRSGHYLSNTIVFADPAPTAKPKPKPAGVPKAHDPRLLRHPVAHQARPQAEAPRPPGRRTDGPRPR